jgi:hypothetical protein
MNNWAAINFAAAAGGTEATRESKRKDATEAKRMATAAIKNEHKNELNNIAFEEMQKQQVLKGMGPGR